MGLNIPYCCIIHLTFPFHLCHSHLSTPPHSPPFLPSLTLGSKSPSLFPTNSNLQFGNLWQGFLHATTSSSILSPQLPLHHPHPRPPPQKKGIFWDHIIFSIHHLLATFLLDDSTNAYSLCFPSIASIHLFHYV